MENVAVIGANSGIGKFLAKRFDALPFCRGNQLDSLRNMETIIFCAAKAHFETPSTILMRSIEDNFLLLERISRIPHKQFIYFSTVDVYPETNREHCEAEDLKIEDLSGGYPSFKLMCEAVVRERCSCPLILRPTSMFGSEMRLNNIMKILKGQSDRVTLSANSSFNCITYEMMANLVEAAMNQKLSGTMNCAARGTVSLAEIAEICGYSGHFGKHVYHAPLLSNEAVIAVVSEFGRTSHEVIEEIVARSGHWV